MLTKIPATAATVPGMADLRKQTDMTQRICEVEGCGKPHVAKGKCSTHYSQEWRAGTHRRPRTFEARFEANFEKTEGCWEWTGTHSSGGYGQVVLKNRRLRAHRVAYELAHGPIPDGLVVRHKCDNPPCVRPDHLELGTKADNNQDREDRGRGYWSNKTHCAKGHPLSGENLYEHPDGSRQCRTCVREAGRAYKEKKRAENPPRFRHVNAEQRAEIRALTVAGDLSQREIAARFGISQPTVSAIVNRMRKYK